MSGFAYTAGRNFCLSLYYIHSDLADSITSWRLSSMNSKINGLKHPDNSELRETRIYPSPLSHHVKKIQIMGSTTEIIVF